MGVSAIVQYMVCKPSHIISPPIGVYSRKPVVVLPRIPATQRSKDLESSKGIHEDDLDRHVEDVLNRQSKFRRTMSGVWAFIKARKCTLSLTQLAIHI